MRKEYKGSANDTALAAGITDVENTFEVYDATGWPTGLIGPFVATIDRGTGTEEKILCLSRTGNVITVSQRGYDDTVAVAHNADALVEHTLDAASLNDHSAHVFELPHATLGDAAPLALGGSSAGVANAASREDHQHPTTGLALSGHTHLVSDVTSLQTALDSKSDTAHTHETTHTHTRLENSTIADGAGITTDSGASLLGATSWTVRPSFIVNGLLGQTADLQTWQIDGVATARILASGGIRVADGTDAAPGFAFEAASGTGFKRTVDGVHLVIGAVDQGLLWAGIKSHSSLTGLDADDHTQYLTETRHDIAARHPASILPDHNALNGLADGNPHPQYSPTAHTHDGVSDEGAVPVGGIIYYSGLIENIPWNWALCDGTNGTPDMRDKFAVGAGNLYAAGTMGGAATVTLTVNELPSHNHTATSAATTHSHSASSSSTSHSHTGSTGSDSHSHTGSSGSTSHSHGHTLSTGNDMHSHTAAIFKYDATGAWTTGANAGRKGEVPTNINTGTDTHSHTVSGSISSESSHTHSVSIGSDSHSHTVSIDSESSHTHGVTVNSETTHTHGVTVNNAGGGAAHENLPPYYALAFIMRVA